MISFIRIQRKFIIGPLIYIIVILIAAVIAFIAVAYHAIKAGLTNPIDSLKIDSLKEE